MCIPVPHLVSKRDPCSGGTINPVETFKIVRSKQMEFACRSKAGVTSLGLELGRGMGRIGNMESYTILQIFLHSVHRP